MSDQPGFRTKRLHPPLADSLRRTRILASVLSVYIVFRTVSSSDSEIRITRSEVITPRGRFELPREFSHELSGRSGLQARAIPD
jgi:hypothetical protein